MTSVVIAIIWALTTLLCVDSICTAIRKVAKLKYKAADKGDLEETQKALDEMYDKEPKLTVESVMNILNEEYGYEDDEEARTEHTAS